MTLSSDFHRLSLPLPLSLFYREFELCHFHFEKTFKSSLSSRRRHDDHSGNTEGHQQCQSESAIKLQSQKQAGCGVASWNDPKTWIDRHRVVSSLAKLRSQMSVEVVLVIYLHHEVNVHEITKIGNDSVVKSLRDRRFHLPSTPAVTRYAYPLSRQGSKTDGVKFKGMILTSLPKRAIPVHSPIQDPSRPCRALTNPPPLISSSFRLASVLQPQPELRPPPLPAPPTPPHHRQYPRPLASDLRTGGKNSNHNLPVNHLTISTLCPPP